MNYDMRYEWNGWNGMARQSKKLGRLVGYGKAIQVGSSSIHLQAAVRDMGWETLHTK